MKYFAGIETLQEGRELFRRHSHRLHPDRSTGSARDFAEMVAEWKEIQRMEALAPGFLRFAAGNDAENRAFSAPSPQKSRDFGPEWEEFRQKMTEKLTQYATESAQKALRYGLTRANDALRDYLERLEEDEGEGIGGSSST